MAGRDVFGPRASGHRPLLDHNLDGRIVALLVLAEVLHKLGEVDVAAEDALDRFQVRCVAVRGELHPGSRPRKSFMNVVAMAPE